MFEEPDDDEDGNVNTPLPPIPKCLILDLTIVTGMDTAAVDVFKEIITLCHSHKCKVYLAGLSRDLKTVLGLGGVKPSVSRNKVVRFFNDLETALGYAEDDLLTNVLNSLETHTRDAQKRRNERLNSSTDDGFHYALKQIDQQHGQIFSEDLAALGKYTTPVELRREEILFKPANEVGLTADCERGLFFIEHGLMKVEQNSSYYSISRANSSTMTANQNSACSMPIRYGRAESIGNVKARSVTVARQSQHFKQSTMNQDATHHFRLARFGPGWVVGTLERFSGLRNPGTHIAVTPCRLHHLPYKNIQEIERENPQLMLHLFKMTSFLMARRQESTVEQLATFHSIMTSPSKPAPLRR